MLKKPLDDQKEEEGGFTSLPAARTFRLYPALSSVIRTA